MISVEKLNRSRHYLNDSIEPFIKVQLNPSLSPSQEKKKGAEETIPKS